jgi:hypothetical protein
MVVVVVVAKLLIKPFGPLSAEMLAAATGSRGAAAWFSISCCWCGLFV